LLTLGVSAAGVASIFAPFRPYMLGLSAIMIGYGFYRIYWKTAHASRFNKSLVWFAGAMAIGFALFPQYQMAPAGSTEVVPAQPGPQVTLAISGMT